MYVISPIAKGNWRGLYARHSESADLDHSVGRRTLYLSINGRAASRVGQRTVTGRKSLVSFMRLGSGRRRGVGQNGLRISRWTLVCCRLFGLIRNPLHEVVDHWGR